MRPLLAALLLLSGCTTWAPRPPSAVGGFGQDGPGRVRFNQASGGSVTVDRPVIVGDSLVGVVDGAQVAFAVDDIQWVEVRTTDTPRTVAVAAGAVTAAVVVAYYTSLTLSVAWLYSAIGNSHP